MTMELAQQLWTARTNGTVLDMSTVEVPGDENSAYEIQKKVSQVSNANIIGFKVGSTTEAGIRALNLSEPFHGPLLDRFCHQHGDKVPLASQHRILIETEIAVGLGKDLPARELDYDQQDIEVATAWIAPAFELVATRFDMELAGNGKLLIADSGVNADFVLGDNFTDWSAVDLSKHPVTLQINDQQVASGHSGMSMFGHPFRVVAWLANHGTLQGRGLKAGDIITTGTCTGMTPLHTGDCASADLGALGTLRMQLITP